MFAGRWFEDTKRGGNPVGDIWNDYHFELPSSDKTSKDEQALPHCNYSTRCDQCRGKGLETCNGYGCNGSGWVSCTQCNGRGRTETTTQIIICGCHNGKIRCSVCKGGGKVHCSTCKGCGGFYHSASLRAEWHTRLATWYCQNSFLPEKKIAKAQRVLFWTNKQQPWSKDSSIHEFVRSLQQDEVQEKIQLKANLINEYQNKHLNPTSGVNNRMRRLICTIERLDFDEVHYTIDNKYVNKQDSALGELFTYWYLLSLSLLVGNTFRFCQFPVNGKGQVIYENDYPLNSCGCFGEKYACYSCCCTIL
jgi:hypothetical protein